MFLRSKSFVLGYVELEHKKNEFIRDLSRGMVQRMGVAALMIHEPELFLLKEPASGLDQATRRPGCGCAGR